MQVVTILVMLTITIALLTAGACASSTDERPPADEVAAAPPEPAATPEPMPTAEPTAPPTPEPELSLDPGTYKVGTDIQPGIYAGRAGIDILNSCNWQRLSGAGGTLEEVIAIEIVQGQFYVEVHPQTST